MQPDTPTPQGPEAGRVELAGEPLFCVHVLGPDDVYAAPDIVTAARWATALNYACYHLNQDVSDDDYVICQANIERWDGTPEEHAAYLSQSTALCTPKRGVIPPGQVVEIDYTNHEGRRAIRKIKPTGRMLVGLDQWHPDAPWLIEARDVDRGVMRTFDPAKIHRWGVAPPASDAGLADASAPDVTELLWAFDEAMDKFAAAAEAWGWDSDQGSDAVAKASENENRRTRGLVYDAVYVISDALRVSLKKIATQAATIARLQAELAAHGEGVTAELRALPRVAGENPDGWEISVPILEQIAKEATDKCGYDDAVLEQVEAIVLATERVILDRARIAAAPVPASDETGGAL